MAKQEERKQDTNKEVITVSGVTFSAEQVKSATVLIDDREVYIGEQQKNSTIGFGSSN